ncbi:MAG: efflux RND transporter periplasmic adaptor subunit [Pseudomonadota bacterium]
MNHSLSTKKWLVFPALAAGIAILLLLVVFRQGPQRETPAEIAQSVRVIEAPEVEVIPRALGYGTVQPTREWEAVAEVNGKVLELSPNHKPGNFLKAGEVLLRIDPADYQLTLARTQAEQQSVQAQLQELAITEENTRQSLKIEKTSLESAERELKRLQSLLKKKSISRSAVDQQERVTLGHRQSVQNLESALNLLPAQHDLLSAQLAVNSAQLESANLSLERTTIHVPFDARIAAVNIEAAQYVRQGQTLLVAYGIEQVEITAQFAVGHIRRLFLPSSNVQLASVLDFNALPEAIKLQARVRLQVDDLLITWPARFLRADATVDPQTRALGIVVAVDNPYLQAQAGLRPPLTKNMFVEVELTGPPYSASTVIPRNAIHNGQTYVVNADNRLERRNIAVHFVQDDFATVQSYLSPGEKVVVSDLLPAIDNMLLKPVLDERLQAELVSTATGQGAD